MNVPATFTAFPDFEAFWTERSPFMIELIKSEFVSFLLQRHIQWAPVEMTASPPLAQPAPPLAQPAPPLAQPAPTLAQPAPTLAQPAPTLAQSAPTEAVPATRIGRDRLFSELVAVYAEAMEYPSEVFTETVELEGELGIDSVKQTEILGRIRETYKLPRLPANVRISDFKTMGQIVDLVFANQGKAAGAT
jgi:acyl carrier protein